MNNFQNKMSFALVAIAVIGLNSSFAQSQTSSLQSDRDCGDGVRSTARDQRPTFARDIDLRQRRVAHIENTDRHA